MTNMPQPYGNLLFFDSLTYSEGVAGAFVLGYRLEDRLDDLWTSRFTEFKFVPTEDSVEGGIRLLAHAASLVTRGFGVERSRTVFAPALRSTEQTASPDGMLSRAARCCAEASGCRFMTSLLEKQSHLRVT